MSANEKRAAGGASSIEVTVLGRSYTVACGEGEREALMKAVAYLDAKMAEIKKSGKVVGSERIAVTTALNLAHELLRMRGRGESADTDVSQKIRQLRERVETALTRGQQLEL